MSTADSDAPEPPPDVAAPADPLASVPRHAAASRPGPTAPRVDIGTVPVPAVSAASDADLAIAMAEELMRVAAGREPRHDPQWPHLESILEAELDRLRRVLDDWWHANPDVAKFYKIRRLLGRG